MTTPMTEEEFWSVLRGMPIPTPVFYRLYYNDDGTPIIYSMEELPGNYIEVDQQTYVLAAFNVKVINNKLVIIETADIAKLVPGNNGTACHPQDVSIVINDITSCIKWQLN